MHSLVWKCICNIMDKMRIFYFQVTSTNFEDISSMKLLLQQLSTTLIQFRLHEEIEDKYIMRVLKQRLDGEMLKKLMRHLHANSYISDLIMLVKNLQKEIVSITCEDTLKGYGERLNRALKMFYEEYLPHMIDEEKVCCHHFVLS